MRKLLILMLVLGVASVASATMTITGPTDVLAGQTYSYSLNGTSAETAVGYGGYVWIDYPSYISDDPCGAISNVGMNATNLTGPMSGYNTGYLPDAFYFVGTSVAGTTQVFVGEWFTFDVTIPDGAQETDTYGIDILSSGFAILQDGALVLHVVPEPLTLCLLGLGGLLLRRRK